MNFIFQMLWLSIPVASLFRLSCWFVMVDQQIQLLNHTQIGSSISLQEMLTVIFLWACSVFSETTRPSEFIEAIKCSPHLVEFAESSARSSLITLSPPCSFYTAERNVYSSQRWVSRLTKRIRADLKGLTLHGGYRSNKQFISKQSSIEDIKHVH